jgi:hypothetical protein
MLSFFKTKEVIVNVGIFITSLIVSFLMTGKLITVGAKYNLTSLNPRSWAWNLILFVPIVTSIIFLVIRIISIPLFLNTKGMEFTEKSSELFQAIFSLIFSWLGFIPLFSIVGVYLGHNAFKKIKISSNSCGSSFAILGLVFGYLWIAIYVFFILSVLLGIIISELTR